jgi:hypothetical protein
MTIWKTYRTLLLVGEGRTEEAFLQYIKSLYAPRGCGLSVKVKNARGKGARHVVEWTWRQLAIARYDAVAVLIDTDKDWSESVARRAKAARILVLKSEPLFEAMMLRLLDQSDVGDSKTLKGRFAPFVRNDALRAENYADYFGRDFLEAQRGREATIDALLSLFGGK